VRLASGSSLPLDDELSAAFREDQVPVVEVDLPTARERAEVRRHLESLGIEPLFVAWLCDKTAARREIYGRYASMPSAFADASWRDWAADTKRREPPGEETGRLVRLPVPSTVDQQVHQIAVALGVRALAPSQAEKHVLVVDDDEEQREIVGATLTELGCHVELAASAAEALEIAERTDLDLVLTDQQMPGATGVDLANELARQRPDLPVAILTGYADETISPALDNGVTQLLAKPLRVSDLIRLLDDLD
jgi:CheY-like chemotaxis protein